MKLILIRDGSYVCTSCYDPYRVIKEYRARSHKIAENDIMSKREMFAAMAMQGMIGCFLKNIISMDKSVMKDQNELISFAAVQLADALIEELEKQKDGRIPQLPIEEKFKGAWNEAAKRCNRLGCNEN